MKNLKKLSVNSVIAIQLVLILAFGSLTTGCSSQQVQDTINVAAEVANSAAAIVAPVSPEYGAEIGAVGATLKDISGLYSAYTAAAAADKPGIAGKLHAVTATLSANLHTILADSHIKAPALVQEISVFVAIANSAISIVLNHLPAKTSVAHAAAQNSAQLPVIKSAKSAADLANAWNQAVGPNHPEAVVNAPKHKKLGIF